MKHGMNSNLENRDNTRFEYEAEVTLENKKTGAQCQARMSNYSDRGLYIEADPCLEPEIEISIGITNSPFASGPDECENYRGVTKWRRSLKRSAYYYGYGVEILEEATSGDDNKGRHFDLRRHPRMDCTIPVKYESNNQTYEGTAGNVSSGGIFIKTRDSVAVGQMVKVDIALKKKGKIKKLAGKVTWSSRSGFGFRVDRSE